MKRVIICEHCSNKILVTRFHARTFYKCTKCRNKSNIYKNVTVKYPFLRSLLKWIVIGCFLTATSIVSIKCRLSGISAQVVLIGAIISAYAVAVILNWLTLVLFFPKNEE
jgi:DNA-directed RNA polymerase subunit RPC12/RpoP